MSESSWPAGPYHLTLDYNVPIALLDSKICTNIDIEIGGLTAEEADSGLQNNMKIVLHFTPTDKISALTLRAVRGRASDNQGYLVLDPFTESDPLEATSILRLDLDEGWTVAEVLHCLVYTNVQHFDFVSRPDKRTYGRRDVLTQILRVWEKAEVLKSTTFKVIHGTTTYLDCIYAALCNRFAENTTVFSAIGKCKFTEGYQHEELDQASYLE